MTAELQPSCSGARESGTSVKVQLGLALVVTIAVSLLTVLFSILGTITSAAVVGMMFGATKHSRWRAAVISLVFPLVSIAFARLYENTLLMAGFCFGTFWLCYALTCAAMLLEQPQASVPAVANPTPDSVADDVPYDPNLLELQGRWTRLSNSKNGSARADTIEVKRDQVRMSLIGPDGKPYVVCSGQVQVSRVAAHRLASIIAPAVTGGATLTAFESGPWIYRIAGGNLTVAWNFGDSASAECPTMETYRRV